MIKILHIIQDVSPRDAARAVIGAAKYSSRLGDFQHRVASLQPAEAAGLELTNEAGITVISAPERAALLREIELADIVQVHWWNTPELSELLRSELPAMRLLIWFHVVGDKAPQMITKEFVDFADFALASGPYAYELSVFQNLPTELRLRKTGMVYGAADFAPLAGIKPQPHPTFNVGYISGVDLDIHPRYLSMCTAIDIPNIRFVVYDGRFKRLLRKQARKFEVEERFELHGYFLNLRPVLEILDVYGYPLREETCAVPSLHLQEVMYAGIPPVVFPYGDVKRLVINDYTGLVVGSEQEYKHAIEYLYHHPEERARLSHNARNYARQIFGAENAAQKLNPIYERMMHNPKRKRLWGYRADLNLLYQPLSLQDLLEKPEKPSGARIFVESLGEARQSFIRSMTAQDLRELLAVEQEIAASPPLMHSAEAGGIIHYQNYYPNDGFLRLWSGLILHQQGRFAEAALEYAAAIKLGCKHWRVVWYLARSAEKAGDLLAAEKALQFVLQAAPDFAEAQEMSQRLTKAGRDYQSTLHEIKSLMETDGSAEASASSSPVSTNTLANEVAEALHVLNSDVERQPVLPQNEASDRETNRVNLIIDFNDLKVGQRVKVKGKLSESGAFVAQKISVKEPEEESAIEGLIRNIDFQRNILYLLNGEVALPEGIEIKGLQQDMISAKELKTGDRVKLKGKHSPRTGFTPEKIKLQENAAFQMEELQGDIDKIDREKKILEVIGFTVRVDEKTIFL